MYRIQIYKLAVGYRYTKDHRIMS